MYGEVHEGTGAALSRLTGIARGREDYSLAVQYHHEVITTFDAYFAGPNLFSAFERDVLAKSLAAFDRYAEAETVLLESLDMIEAIYGTEHEQGQRARERLDDLHDQRKLAQQSGS